MQTEQPWYVDLRAKALAMLAVTCRDDLIVSKQENQGLDILVTITKNDQLTGRVFGVSVQATMSSSDIVQYNKDVFHINFNEDQIKFFQEFPFPICLFFFRIDNNNGYYKWILEPVYEEQNFQKLSASSNRLKFNKSNEFKRLTNEEIDNIFDLVNDWYDYNSPEKRDISDKTFTTVPVSPATPQPIKPSIDHKELSNQAE
ncbi:MAG TPA: DUF4365 domain-containing protein [Nostocaceae cyanobacterium]|nr:DUF4365 domain-containing protein [Nostocaceae cyanobacterium]